MPKMIFVNLPVHDVAAATAFYETVGATKNPMFSDATTSCMVFSDTIHVMLLSQERFAGFLPGYAIADATKATGVILCLSADSREEVSAIVDRAGTAGGTADPTPTQDHGFMFGRSFRDADGHIWEIV